MDSFSQFAVRSGRKFICPLSESVLELYKLWTNLLNSKAIGYIKSENLSLKLLILHRIVLLIRFISISNYIYIELYECFMSVVKVLMFTIKYNYHQLQFRNFEIELRIKRSNYCPSRIWILHLGIFSCHFYKQVSIFWSFWSTPISL